MLHRNYIIYMGACQYEYTNCVAIKINTLTFYSQYIIIDLRRLCRITGKGKIMWINKISAEKIVLGSFTTVSIPDSPYSEYVLNQLRSCLDRRSVEKGTECTELVFRLGIPSSLRERFDCEQPTSQKTNSCNLSNDFVEQMAAEEINISPYNSSEEYAILILVLYLQMRRREPK